ncbi:hypothetical protein OH76DRAFT_1405507 [Lentinus brumalis]|uniref:Peptidase C14 caspase domain-containing protein n=1 Tax=Lentinus brumalis TaxID=2498619 RepID=A0A371D613_9APHY|nr:hypothetical protein OH76DRAFT_1405507 [Polyporus brumalis]
MADQVFALIIGIDKYQAGNIWNLNAAVDDARSIERWLTSDLQVPRDHICTLLDAQATRRNIEERFLSHLLNNSAIEPGDAIIVYFAGHGSSIRAPPGWFDRGRGDVSVLCTYDYDTKLPKGQTNAGISDRSLHAMLQDLARVKGDNITLILDTCFSLATTSNDDPKERRFTRFTPTRKATSEDLLAGLWSTATPHKAEPVASRGFTGVSSDSHVVLAACSSGWAATERKDGGNFTRALLALKDARPLHKFTYADLPAELAPYMGDHQYAACAGMNVDRILFDGVPFVPDTRYISVSAHDHEHVQVDAGEMQGITVGTEFAIYPHNRRGSLNGSTGIYVATLVFATWCLAKPKSSGKQTVREGWARVTRWNNQTPFRVDVKYSLFSFFRRNRLAAKVPSNAVDLAEKNGVGVLRAKSAKSADLSVKVKSKELLVERRDALIPANCQSILHIPSAETRTDLKAIEAAARFNMHLYRKQPSRPFAGKVSMELFRLDPSSWRRTSGNLLVKGRAQIVDEKAANSIYAVVLHNDSDVDLWPYLAYMDAGGYSISMVYHPDPAASGPPLRRHSHMVIGSGSTESEALSFALADGADKGAGFLKLFVSTVYTPMTILEQGPTVASVTQPMYGPGSRSKTTKFVPDSALWDSLLASITVVRTTNADK